MEDQFDDSRVELELLRREFHENEMRTRTTFTLVGGGVELGHADSLEEANALKEKMEDLLICKIEITEDWEYQKNGVIL